MDMQSRNLTLPRGSLLFAKYKPGTQIPGPFRELGNCPEFTLTRESETLPHYSSRQGLRQLDEEIAIESTLTGAVTTDDMKAENVAYFFMGDVNTVTVTASSNQTETFEDVKAGDLFQLGFSDTNPSGARKVTTVVVTDGAATAPATFALDEDYILDADLGTVYIPVGSGAIGGDIEVAYGIAASTREQIAAGETQVEGALKFISNNPVGPNGDTIFPRVRLSPNGDLNMILDPESSEWAQLPLSISVMKKGNLALAYRDGRPVA
ncbi:hypothetical protein L905_19250 [Agrobacterium sp. TS43]|uniref:phage tail tube protein n=1 Tax=Agrobacterium TaxID=357 RepID=UPI0004A1A501|nr:MULTISPECIES: hypothetical protein [Agrobacterium]KDR87729.1 hypothetical protein K538_07215 [Agrobacterium tumefaciens GW4]KVK49529.1 hypothetical protein L903_19610 [Agrobacterium sp. JL28]KVK49766.1 hypothetical protein L904_19600 [Agrobacterium sp. LY4]KVK62707.1 hypothetical protein L906_18725 [Agrobacterium sp. TS45]KVK65092.1 hypothetical protein L905_19250 [Agrobacterium sp. TS43]